MELATEQVEQGARQMRASRLISDLSPRHCRDDRDDFAYGEPAAERAWEGCGIVVGGRQRVTITDAHRLVMLAERPRD